MDLNPLSTPSNVLTDCINGTFITYNGNEFSLQNDQGNIKLQYCKLKPNYIPVGIKEHGDILYIVSYNPLDKKVEIGSYPSPLQVSESDKDNNIDIKSIIKENLIDSGTFEGNYSELITKEKQIIFNGDDYKLYPGDSYKLEIEEEFPYKYETLEYFILDEDSNIHDISEEIVKNENDFSYISWDVPGWIVSKIRLAKLAFAGLNVRSFYAPETSDGRNIYYEFNIRLNIEDKILKNVIKDYESNKIDKSEILFDISFSGKNERDYPKHLNKSITNITDWYKDNKIVWEKVDGKFSTTKDDVITVELVPKLVEFDESGNILYTIVYDNLKQIQEFDLSKVNDKAFGISDDFYKFYQINDKEQVLEFDVSGPLITTSVTDLYYNIYSIDNQNGNPILRNKVNDYSGIGRNWIAIPFNDVFQKEDIYTIEFEFIGNDGSNFKSSRRLLITTELLNGTENIQVYDRELNMDDLVEKYKSKLNQTFKCIVTSDGEFFQNDFNIKCNTDVYDQYCKNSDFNTFIPSEYEISELKIDISKPGKQTINIKNSEILTGKLWEGLVNYKLTKDDDVLLSEFKNNVHQEININKKHTLIGTPKIYDRTEFCKFTGWYLDQRYRDFIVNITQEGSNYKIDWGYFGGIRNYNEDNIREITLDLSSFPTIYKGYIVRLIFTGSKTVIRSCEKLSNGWSWGPGPDKTVVVWSGDRAGLINYKDENELNTILHYAFCVDNISDKEDYSIYYTDLNDSFTGIVYDLKSTFSFNNWKYNGFKLYDLIKDYNILSEVTSYENVIFTTNCIFERELDFEDVVSDIKKNVSLEKCAEQINNWNNHPINVNIFKTSGKGVYCNDNPNDYFGSFIRDIDHSYKTSGTFDSTSTRYDIYYTCLENKYVTAYNLRIN